MFTIRLFFLDLFSWIYKAIGVDYKLFRRIMELKFRLDERVDYRAFDGNKNRFASYTGYLFTNLMTGILMSIFLWYKPLVEALMLCFTIIITIIVAQTLTDFERAFFDTKDTMMLKALPVDSKTLNAAKITHIINYTFFISISLAIPIMVTGYLKYGIEFVFLMLGCSILVAIFSVCIALLIYLVLFKFINADVLKYLITYIQAVIVAVLPSLSQILIRLESLNIGMSKDFKLIHLFLPQIWFTAPFGIFYNEFTDYMFYLPALMGIVLPLVLFVITIINYANIENVILKLNRSQIANTRVGLFSKLGNFVSKPGLERASYRFTLDMIRTDRIAINEVLPNTLTTIALCMVLLIGIEAGTGDFNNYFYFIYWFTLANLLQGFYNISYSENYEASWIFDMLGYRDKVNVAKGVTKAFMIKYIAVPHIVITIVLMAYFKVNLVKLFLIQFLFMLILSPLIYTASVIKPFSCDKSKPAATSLGSLGTLILVVTVLGFSGYFIHRYIDFNDNYYYFIGILIVLTIFLWKYGISLMLKSKEKKPSN